MLLNMSMVQDVKNIISLCPPQGNGEKKNAWQDEQMKCRNLYAVGAGERVRKTAVCIFEISIVLNPQFSGALSQGVSF
jgi:hypothetical protein